MCLDCSCNGGIPTIREVQPSSTKSFFARHYCSHCDAFLFDVALNPGMQIIATKNIVSSNGEYVVPKGRMLRISAFSELSASSTGLVFAGLFAVGAFHPGGFAAKWDVNRLLADKKD